jgi:hypothetical protein
MNFVKFQARNFFSGQLVTVSLQLIEIITRYIAA